MNLSTYAFKTAIQFENFKSIDALNRFEEYFLTESFELVSNP